MYDIIYNTNDGNVNIKGSYNIDALTASVDSIPYLHSVGEEYIVNIINIHNVSKFTTFTYSVSGLSQNRYLTTSYRISRDTHAWSIWYDLNTNITNFPLIDSKDPLFMDIKWTRSGKSSIGDIGLISYEIDGIVERNEVDGEATIILLPGKDVIMKAPFIYKVFKITDTEIISKGDISNLSIKYRFSQDTGRTWSNWEDFTKENITTVRITPIRFFQIEYLIKNNSSSSVKIYDINLIGNFQNVTQDYYKTNLYGIRECCKSLISPDSGGNLSGNLSGQGCDTTNQLKPMSDADKAKLFNPYQQTAAMNLLNKLSSDAQQVFGFNVEYFLTDPDKKGIDTTLHEFQLYNIVCSETIKVSVNGNNFPDSQITMNQFDLNLFETMEVHITKDNFKQLFGPHRRPGKEDFLYFCDVNRMFIVDHAQQFRGFNNSAVYYKLILKKYNQKANVKTDVPAIQDKLNQLTSNSTINELFGIENTQDKAAVANKDQTQTLTRDPIRLEYLATIGRELIENSSTIISKSHYELMSVPQSGEAVKYKNVSPIIKVSDNIGFMAWFSINNYVVDDVYNLFDYYEPINNLGWKANLTNDKITVNLNSDSYQLDFSGGATISNTIGLSEDTWYCYVLNIDQRQRKIDQFIYKRNVDDESTAASLNSTILRKVHKNSQDMTPVEFEIGSTGLTSSAQILGSDMKMTNIRLFIDVIPEDTHNKILNQSIIRDDSKYLVFADNANTKITLPYFPYGNE